MFDGVKSSLGSGYRKLDHVGCLVGIKLVCVLLIRQKCADFHGKDSGPLGFNKGKIPVDQVDIVLLLEVCEDTDLLPILGSEHVVFCMDTVLGELWLVRENKSLDGVWLLVYMSFRVSYALK